MRRSRPNVCEIERSLLLLLLLFLRVSRHRSRCVPVNAFWPITRNSVYRVIHSRLPLAISGLNVAISSHCILLHLRLLFYFLFLSLSNVVFLWSITKVLFLSSFKTKTLVLFWWKYFLNFDTLKSKFRRVPVVGLALFRDDHYTNFRFFTTCNHRETR